MAYFVSASATFRKKLTEVLTELFKGKVEISEKDYTLTVKVGRDAGFKTVEERLTPEELANPDFVTGGGIKLGLDGRTFLIEVREIKEPKIDE